MSVDILFSFFVSLNIRNVNFLTELLCRKDSPNLYANQVFVIRSQYFLQLNMPSFNEIYK